jgi:hypothetical protein
MVTFVDIGPIRKLFFGSFASDTRVTRERPNRRTIARVAQQRRRRGSAKMEVLRWGPGRSSGGGPQKLKHFGYISSKCLLFLATRMQDFFSNPCLQPL